MSHRQHTPGLNSAHEVECEKFSQPLISNWPASCPLNNIQIRRPVGFHDAWTAVKESNIPTNDYLIGESAGMCALHQRDQFGPARKFAV
jgi:hypothetical protein